MTKPKRYKAHATPPKPPRKCIYCGRGKPEVEWAREHPWSNWLKRLLPSVDGAFHVTSFQRASADPDRRANVAPRKVSGPVHRRTVANVCYDCNNGWMKDIVDRSKAPLEKLILGEPVTLSADEQAAVAHWCILATMSVSTITISDDRVPPEQYEEMYRNHRPATNWRVFIGTRDGPPDSNFRYTSSPLFGVAADGSREEIAFVGQFSHALGKLVATVAYFKPAEFPLPSMEPALAQIWPVVSQTVTMPRQPTMWGALVNDNTPLGWLASYYQRNLNEIASLHKR